MRKLILTLMLLTASPALAWNLAGHMVVGAIAYDSLKKDHPQTLAKVLEILKANPQFADVISERLKAVDEADRDKYLFMISSRWPDDIRDKPQWTHPEWHYIDFQFVPDRFVGQVATSQPADSNALVAFKNESQVLKESKDPQEAAIAACWILHLSGDLDQPLHAVSLYTPEFPQGDKGGNSLYVKADPNGYPIKLHSLWDGLVTGTDKFTDAKNIATALENRPEFAKAKLQELTDKDPEHWAHTESFPLAVKYAYLDGNLPHSASRESAPLLPPDYLKNAKAVAERRVLASGYRAAQTFVDDLGP